MNRLSRFLTSSVGAKFTMAVTGIVLALFVVGHLSGNLLVYKGRTAMNDYGEFLRSLGAGLWIIRAGLLFVFVLHVWSGIRLARLDRAARPIRYVHEDTVQASIASRSMLVTGLLVLAYLALHLAHFTFGVTSPESAHLTETVVRNGIEHTRHDVYAMVVTDFHSNVYVVVYVVAMALLGLHLSHGLHSLFQTLGVRHRVYTPWIERIGRTVAWLLAVGYMTIPIAVRIGLVGTEAAS